MDKNEKFQLAAAIIIGLPLLSWIIVAEEFYHLSKGGRVILFFLISHTFSNVLWPLPAALTFGFCLGIIAVFLISSVMSSKFSGAPFREFYRGTRIVGVRKMASLTKSRKEAQITMAGVPVPVKAETTHFSIGGATGTGKSTLIKEMIVGVMSRQRKTGQREKMVILDPDGHYYSLFGGKKDKILNPFDKRSEGWSFFNEIENVFDYSRLSNSIIQPSPDREQESWNRYARMFLQDVTRKMMERERQPTVKRLYELTQLTEDKDLKDYLHGTSAAGMLLQNAEKAIASTRFVLGEQLAPHLAMPHGDFSIRRWVEDKDAGNLFITWGEAMRNDLKPLLSSWVDTLFSSVLGADVDLARRVWVFMDELESLNYLPTLKDALTKGRKKGLCIVTGWQSYSQLVEVYGQQVAETMLSNHRTVVVFAVGRNGSTTAEHMSKALGQHEVLRRQRSRSSSFSRSPNINDSDQVRLEKAVLESEIMRLPDLEGYMAFPGDYPVCRFKMDAKNYVRESPPPGIALATQSDLPLPQAFRAKLDA